MVFAAKARALSWANPCKVCGEDVALGQSLLRDFGFPLLVIFHECSVLVFIYMSLFSRKTNVRIVRTCLKQRRSSYRWGEVRRGEVRWGEVRWGEVRRGEVRSGEVRWGEVRRGEVRWGEVRWGEVRRGEVRWGEVRAASHLLVVFKGLVQGRLWNTRAWEMRCCRVSEWRWRNLMLVLTLFRGAVPRAPESG